MNKVPVFVLMLGLPDFKENASVNLLTEIAQKKFESDPQYEKIMQVFRSSINTDDFLMHFEYYRNHAKISELNALLRTLFQHTGNLQNFSITEEYKQQRAFENSLE